MNKSSTGIIAVIIVILLIVGVGLYLTMSGTSSVPVVTPPITTTTPPPTNPAVTTTTTTTTTTTAATSTPFVLTAAQQQALISFGFSSTSIPATISVEQEACFVTKLGTVRVVELKAGAVPSASDLVKAKSCL